MTMRICSLPKFGILRRDQSRANNSSYAFSELRIFTEYLDSASFGARNAALGRLVVEQGSGRLQCGRMLRVRLTGQISSRLGGENAEVETEIEEGAGEDNGGLTEVAVGSRAECVDGVEVTVEKIGSNKRKIVAKIAIGTCLEKIWDILTSYEQLAEFIPGLAVSEVRERRENGCRLYQVGEQDIALGVKFKAKALVDCEEKPYELETILVRRDIDFNTIEGDFQIFKGTWRMEQVGGSSSFVPGAIGGVQQQRTYLYYILDVQPKMWLPVRLVEGRLTSEIKLNLMCIRDKAERETVDQL